MGNFQDLIFKLLISNLSANIFYPVSISVLVIIQIAPNLTYIKIRAMGEIDFTNIIIDDFRKGKQNPFNKYIYILSHIHSDHLRGLNNSWNFGPIYCSQITSNLILNKYPNLSSCVRVLPLDEPQKLTLAENVSITVTFFDANHCAGAVMVLLEGYFGRFLYTGDFRFDRKKFKGYTYLYPPESTDEKFQKCSKFIDKMWLDNTFCNPRFKFLAQAQAMQIALSFVKQHPNKRIYVGMDYYGKQQILINIAKQLDTIIVVDEQRYENIIAMQFDPQLFTTNPEQGRIEIISKPKLHDKLLENPEALGLVMSGWALERQWRKVKGTDQSRIYYIPYSLHSNYQQIVSFLRSTKPSQIQPIVSTTQSHPTAGTDQLYNTTGNEQAFAQLLKKHTSPISANYKKNLDDRQFQDALRKRFGFDRKSQQINRTQLGMSTVYMPPRGKGYRIGVERDEEEISRVVQQYRKSKEGKRRSSRRNNEITIEDNQDSSEIMVMDKQQPDNANTKAMGNLMNYKENKKQNVNQSQENQIIINFEKIDWHKVNKIQLVTCSKDIQDMYRYKLKQLVMKII